MKLRSLHRWNLSIAEARAVQERLAKKVRHVPLRKEPRLIAGTDVSYDRHLGIFIAGVVVLSWPDLETVEERTAAGKTPFPYVPGYLSFREIPSLAEALARVESRIDLIVCDGQGIAHPRRLGLASHLGLLADLPTIGAAKSRLIGKHAEPGPKRGAGAVLKDGAETIGRVVRTREGVKPLYVSVGHRITLKEAERWVLRLSKTRLPEPTRRADRLVARELARIKNRL